MADRNFKHRQAKGEKAGNAKLKEWQVRQIRDEEQLGATYTELANKYNVQQSTIRSIVNRDTWKHI